MNLLKADLFHFIKDKVFYVLIAITFLIPLVTCAMYGSNMTVGNLIFQGIGTSIFCPLVGIQLALFFGKDYANNTIRNKIISAVVHIDETTPHLHLNLMPIRNGRLCCKDLFNRAELTKLQTDFHEAVGKRWGLERGREGSPKKHLSTAEYKAKKIILNACNEAADITENAQSELRQINQAVMAKNNEKEFIGMLQTAMSKEIRKDLFAKTKECDEAEKRVKSLDRIIQSLYEDKVCGNITDERFAKMSQSYEQEQATLTERIKVLRKEVSTAKEEATNVTKFMRLVKRYTEITELTPEIVRVFIEKVIVYQAEKVNGKRRQAVEIIYNCVGVIPNPTQE